MTTILLLVIVFLQLAILVLLVTGWPGRKQQGTEEIGSELFRDLAQQRADYIQLFHAMRIELEESLRETVEEKLDSIAALSSRQNNRRKKPVEYPLQPDAQGADNDEENGHSSLSNAYEARSAEDERQLGLFAGSHKSQKPKDKAPEESVVSFICTIDDIPDINDLPDVDDL
jgi:spore cortex formation protein SpoVR/YcgB (stage V sporulation)